MPSPSTKPPHIISPLLENPHGFFGIQGGVSKGRFASLNCGALVGDDTKSVAENRARVAAAMGVTPENLIIITQTHSADCVTVTADALPGAQCQGDALVTDQPGLALAILTADCVPVLFEGFGVIGAAHAGWGGALKGILESTVDAMRQLGAYDIRAVIGPAIARDSYEVSKGFEEPFIAEDPKAGVFFTPGATPDKYQFDLPGYCVFRLMRAGVETIEETDIDTCPENSGYFSHRRASLKGEPTPGRQVSAISLKRA